MGWLQYSEYSDVLNNFLSYFSLFRMGSEAKLTSHSKLHLGKFFLSRNMPMNFLRLPRRGNYDFFYNGVRVKSGHFRHQVNSDMFLQTMEIQMRIFTVC